MFSTFLECSHMSGVFYHSHDNTPPTLPYLLYDRAACKTITFAFSMF